MIAVALFLQVADLSGAASQEVARQECKSSDKDEVLVCGKRGRSPFRLPPPPPVFDPFGDDESVMRERMSWVEEGESGTQSCGPVGPGGWTGCLVKQWRESREQTAWTKNIPGKK